MELKVAVRAHAEGVDSERDVLRIGARAQLSLLDRRARLALEHAQPLPHHAFDRVVNGAATSIELDRRGRQEAAAGEGRVAEVGDPRIADRVQPSQTRRLDSRRLVNGAAEDLRSLVESGKLEILLGAEAADQPALAYLELAGQAPDRQTLEAHHRRELNGCLERLGAGKLDVVDPAP